MKPEELDILLERHHDGSLSEAEEQALTGALAEHDWAQDRFVSRMTLAADLHDRLESDSAPHTTTIVPFPKADRVKWAIGLAVAAALAFGLFLFQPESASPPKVRVIAAEGVGTLNTAALEAGRRIKLRRGILELELNGESRVVIEAPAKFKIVTPRLLRLSSGRCFAEMEKGKSGLRIETPAGEVLDLGTKFAVDVPSPKEMKVHVFDGMVEVSGGSTKKLLKKGQSMRVAESGVAADAADSTLFIPRVPHAIIEDTPYIHWSFDEGQGEKVSATGRNLQTELGVGTIIQRGKVLPPAGWETGVSGSAVALRSDSWVNTKHPGISGNQDRTVACWIKLPAEPKSADAAPLISWGMQNHKAKRQSWTLSVAKYDAEGRDPYGVLNLNIGGHITFGATNLRDGEWHHVAVVAMEVGNGSAILLYVDGQLETTRRGPVALDTQTDHERSYPVQFGRHLFNRGAMLRGAIDEAYIFAAALSGNEIRQLMNPTPATP